MGSRARDEPTRRGALRIPTVVEIRDVARLALPIVVVQVGLMLMGTVDTAMVGRVSAVHLAAVALGNFWWFTVALFGAGVIMALDPVVAQSVGAEDREGIALGVQRGVLLALGLTVVISLLLAPSEWIFRAIGQPAEVVPLAARWVQLQIPGVFPFLLFVVARQTLQSFQLVRPIVLAVVIGNVVNVVLNWILIFGNLGAPAMGAIGSSISTTIGRWAMALSLLYLGRHALSAALLPWRRAAFTGAPMLQMLKIGIPIGIHQFFEVVAFGGALALIGLLGTVPLAGHEVTITLAALTYMVPLGVNAAAAVLVGHAIGRDDDEGARREASAALVCGVGFMSLTAIILLSAPQWLARLFTSDPGVVAVAAALIPIAGVFQVFDGVQGVSSGILRGAGDTRVPMLINLLGYVAIGLPLGAWLCFSAGLGAVGMWWGLVAGLVVTAVSLGWRVDRHLRGDVARVVVDARD